MCIVSWNLCEGKNNLKNKIIQETRMELHDIYYILNSEDVRDLSDKHIHSLMKAVYLRRDGKYQLTYWNPILVWI